MTPLPSTAVPSLRWTASLALAAVVAGCSGGAPAAPDDDVSVTPPGAAAPAAATPLRTVRPAPAPAAPASTPAAAPAGDAGPVATPSDAAEPSCAPCWGDPEVTGTFDVTAVPEASGLVASRRQPGAWWLADDGPVARLFAVDAGGAALGSVALEGLEPRDVEGLAAGPCAEAPIHGCLFVGDIGDNDAVRADVVVARLPEPDPAAAASATVQVARLRYPDGAADAEALLVDGQQVVVVTKDGRVYASESFADGVLVAHGRLALPRPARPLQSLALGVLVTGADVGGGRVALRTYDSALELAPPPSGATIADLASWTATEVPSAVEPQSEAIAYALDAEGYTTTGEGTGELWTVRRR